LSFCSHLVLDLLLCQQMLWISSSPSHHSCCCCCLVCATTILSAHFAFCTFVIQKTHCELLLCPWEHWVGDILPQVVAMLCEMATKILQNSSQNLPIFFAKQSSKEGQSKYLYLHYIKCGIVHST
jgi:hypothetical protein